MNEKEMVKIEIGAILEKVNMGDGYADINSFSDQIYHIVLPEGSVVLSKEEYEILTKTAQDKIGNMKLNEFIKACLLSGWAVEATSTEEYEKLCKEKNDYKQRYQSSEKRYEQSVQSSCEAITKARKETAKEILKLVKEKSWCYQEDENGEAWTYSITVTQLKELAKQYGVEVEE